MNIQRQHWVRFENAGATGFGTLAGSRIAVHRGDMFSNPEPTGETVSLDAVRLLMPSVPSKVIALWNNFAALGAKLNLAVPAEPLYLLKAPNSFANPGDLIKKPRCDGKVVFEGELGIVIGKRASGVSEADALDHVFGYTCGNDVSDRVLQRRESEFGCLLAGKGYDTFAPMGPVIATGLDPSKLGIITRVNGAVRQNGTTADLLFSVPELIAYLSRYMTLLPGDMIMTGTPAGVGPIQVGDTIEVDIEGIGILRNNVVAENRRSAARG